MTRRLRGALRSAGAIVAAVTVAALAQPPAIAHEERPVGGIEIEVGWLEEPPLAGFRNGAVLIASRSGEPVGGARLQVVLIFGGQDSDTRSEPLSMEPRPGFPGQYVAAMIPTRPGRYTFEITGRLGGRRFNEAFTSGPQGFEEVRSPADAQFPDRDPTSAEITTRLDRLDARVGQALGEIRGLAAESGPDPTTLILAGAGAALGALALAIALLRRPASPR
jgi:hypothetical protein